ncbi:mycothiol system anti-sigma-R factor [Nocardioides marmotae]|uniref:Mycothiol system anti-sigma-R factor n=1 Tax=Nocardioides marmotae TaxID=2663857 RepID=A0A6I3JAX0_9ACTN|nr:mycothiol system anti-sigma-R factor [Nocardioides marmotae]MCR6031619.1 mycothiol system anti-sigma-R factor [Gordonia jinghuaiqii]MBC9733223.1 mycothiol system anti-sigma-R factor [Nocardioides marmotae]MTB84334.1 mycothiol system anti-sigma-R factor [Nocardioides marmotae]MTB95258.1 mycothiol system anti-sigma-R factor [Nocardioides marmotae]QKE02270.1 mycothiol system anti-sigma-R factor [Nocardioides marmotae]
MDESRTHQHVDPQQCADYLEQIVYFIDNELAEADCAAVRVHLDTCNPCLEKYDLERTVKQVVARSCSEPAPAELRERVMLRIREVQVRITEG